MTPEEIEGEVGYINASGLSDQEALSILAHTPEFARVTRWVESWRGSSRRRNSSIFNQDRYTIPDNIFDQFRVAADAAKYDDVVSNAIEVTEQIAFNRISIECEDDDLNNIAQQIFDNMDMLPRMREIWRELFTLSQCYIAVQWGVKDFRVKGRRRESGRPAKATYNKLRVPIAMTLLDPLKVIPVGNFMFGNEKLVYIADKNEWHDLDETLAQKNSSDLVAKTLFVGKYKASPMELEQIREVIDDIDITDRLYLLDPDNVWRITATRPSYQRFADVRMTSVFELLDLKHNLRESDRSDILGNLNCIVLIKKGSDKYPAQGDELQGLAAQMKAYTRNSMMITDHRVEIEILTKKVDHTLQPERHNMLDSRITARLFQVLATGNYAAGTAVDDSTKLFKVIAASMEARRDAIRESIMDNLIEKIWDRNDKLTGDPKMVFYPRRIALDFDPNYSQALMELFQTGYLSHETMLDELGIDQDAEAYRREREDNLYKDIFTPKLLPGQGMSPQTVGRSAGGNKNGGGQNQDSGKPSPSNQPKDPVASDVKKQQSP